MRKAFTSIKKILSSSLRLLFGVLAVPLVIAFAFIITHTESPAVSELAFIEYSSDATVLGSVIPASCESGYEHYPGECAPPPPVVSLSGSPTTINLGQSSTLSWTVSGATSCTASGGWTGGKSAVGGSEGVVPTATRVFSLTCYGPGGSTARSVTVTVNPPSVTLTATPAAIDAGNNSTLTWTVAYASSCIASGGWTGSKSTSGGSELVSPVITTSYSLNCVSSSGSTNQSVLVRVPSGNITATDCTIPAESSDCFSSVTWNAYDFFGTPDVVFGTTTISNSPSGTQLLSVNPDNRTFTLSDGGGAFTTSYSANIGCAAGSVWAGNRCVTLPVIDIFADPNIVRSGNTAPIEIDITANYDLVCTLSGGVNETFNHLPSVTAVTYNFTTRPLTAAQIVRVDCVSPLYPTVSGGAEVRVEVIPTIQEI